MFSLTWPASMQIYWNKRKRLPKKRDHPPEDWFGTPTWQLWRHVKTLFLCVWLMTGRIKKWRASSQYFNVWVIWKKKIRLNHSCQNLNSHLLPLYTSYTKSGEKVLKCQHNSSCVFVSLILITTLFYKSSILRGEIWFWSSLGLKGFNAICPLASLPS